MKGGSCLPAKLQMTWDLEIPGAMKGKMEQG